MSHKKSSIHIHTLKSKRISIKIPNPPQNLLTLTEINQLPDIIRNKLSSVNSTDRNIIKTTAFPHGYLVSFCIAFLKLLFIQKPAFQKCVMKLFEILDDDKFSIHTIKDPNSYLYLDWSISKIKRMTSEYFKEIMIEEYQNVEEILHRNTEFIKVLFFIFWSMVHDSSGVENFEDFIDFDTVKEVLFDYFEIEAHQKEDTILIPDSSILIGCVDDTDLYIVNLPNFESELEKSTSKSIPIKYDMGGSDMVNALKLTFKSSLFIEDEQNNLVRTRNFAELTNRTQDVNQNMQKTLRYRELRFNTEHERPSMTTRDKFTNQSQKSNESSERSLFKNHANDEKVNCKKLESKFKINRLFQMASHRTPTQKSLYDVTPVQDSDQYSVLDISIPTSKKIHEKSVNKQNQINDMAESLKPQHESLIGKWHQFCKTKKTKQEIQSENQSKLEGNKISKLGKEVQKKSHFQQTTEKPDFRKVKSRRRKSQDFDQQNYPSENPSEGPSSNPSSLANKQALDNSRQKQECKKQGQKKQGIEKQGQKKKECEKQGQRRVKEYILQNPKGLKGENIYSKYGYVNMNISEEFTDSLILKELETKNESKIKAIKDKAREERKTIQLLVEKAEKPQIIKL